MIVKKSNMRICVVTGKELKELHVRHHEISLSAWALQMEATMKQHGLILNRATAMLCATSKFAFSFDNITSLYCDIIISIIIVSRCRW